MIEDRFYEICRQNYPIKILTHATYEAKQTLASKGLSPAIFLSPFYMQKGEYSMEVTYGLKEKSFKPLPEICPIDYDEYDTKQRDELMNKSIRQTVVESQCKIPKNITSETFKSRQSIENYLNNLNFHWFENSLRKFYHGISLSGSYDKNTLDQAKGVTYIVEVNDKSLKENFQKIKRETDALLKKMYYLNPNQVKAIPVMAVVLFDPNKKYSYQDVKNYSNSLKSDYGIESVLTAKLEINGPSTIDSDMWSNYTRPVFTFTYGLTSSDNVKLLSKEGMKSMVDIVTIQKERIKKMIDNRLEVLFKKYDENYSMSNKIFGFFKGNTTPKGKYLVTEQAEARQTGDLMFLLEDYKKAHDIYRSILKDFEKREHSIQMDLRYSLSLCYEMGKFISIKVNSTTPKNHLEKQAELFPLYEKLGKRELTKFLTLFLYQLHTFKIFDPNLIKEQYFPMIKRSMNMPEDDRKVLDEQSGVGRQHFLIPTLLYEQYSNLNLLYQYIDYRRYCYDTVRVSMKYSEYRIYGHALRCLLLVENVYVETFTLVEKYVAVHLSSDFVEARNFNESLASIKKAWKILAENTTFHDYNYENQIIQFKKMVSNHTKIMAIFSELSPDTLKTPDDKTLIIPHVAQTDIRLSGEQQISQTDRTGISWTQISENFNENTELYSQGYNKATMEKIFKLFDCTYSQEKELIYRVNCENLTPAIINRHARISYVKEPIKLCFTFYNPFIQEIRITDFQVLIKDSYQNFETVKNPQNQSLVIKPRKKVDVCFEIIPQETGLLEFQGLQWVFEKMTTQYSFRDLRNVDSKLKPFYSVIRIVQPKGKLKVYENVEQQLFEGEGCDSKVVLQNCGELPIDSIYIAYGSHQFYGKKYEKLNITLKPKQRKEISFKMHLPGVPQSIKKDWKLMDKKVFLYKTDSEFRVHRSSILTLINKVLFYKIKCEKLSTHLHLLTFTHERGYEKLTHLESMIIKAGFVISKVDRTQFENTETYYFYLTKDKDMGTQVFNFSTQMRQNSFNGLSVDVGRLKSLPIDLTNDKIDLVFGWKAEPKRAGLIDMKPLHITPLKEQVLPFLFTTTMPFTIRHNFTKEPVLERLFDVKIKNIFQAKQIGVKIELIQNNLNGLYWQGVTERSFRLKNDEQVNFDVSFVVSKQLFVYSNRSGVYDVSECLKYTVEIDRHAVIMKHSEHEKFYLHVIDESCSVIPQKKSDPILTSSINMSEPISMSDSTLMFSKKPVDKDNFFMGEFVSMAKKTSQKKEDIFLIGTEDSNLISSPREPRSPRFSKIVENDLLGSKIQSQPQQQTQKQPDQSDNLIDLL